MTSSHPPESGNAVSFLLKWTPRTIAMVVGGYYGLGIAYDFGWMAAIDQIAIPIIKSLTGYFGVGFIMPTFQWYAAWGVRIGIGLCAGVVYDLAERVVFYVASKIKSPHLSEGVRVIL